MRALSRGITARDLPATLPLWSRLVLGLKPS